MTNLSYGLAKKDTMCFNSTRSIGTTDSSEHATRDLQGHPGSVDLKAGQSSLPSTSILTRFSLFRSLHDKNHTQNKIQSNRDPSKTLSPDPACNYSDKRSDHEFARRTSNNTNNLKTPFAQKSLPYKVVKNRSNSCINTASVQSRFAKIFSRNRQRSSATQPYIVLDDDGNSLDTVPTHRRSNPPQVVIPDVVEEIISDDEGENIDDNAPFSNVPAPLQDADFEITGVITRKASNQSTGFTEIHQVKNAGYNCTPGRCVELKDGSFMRLKRIVEDREKATWVVGQLFLRHNDFNDTTWPRRHNEVVQMVKVKNDQVVDLVRKPLNQVLKNRHLIVTNQSFPIMSYKDHSDSWRNVELDKELGPLFCRWKQTHTLDDTGRVVQEAIEKVSFEAADSREPGAQVEPSQLRSFWRQRPTTLGGEYFYFQPQVTDTGHEYVEDQMYVFADAFCGAGGASCGADQAGLFVRLGVDLNEKAIKTYKLNFSHKGAECRVMDIYDFIARTGPDAYKIDVLHISPPCQPFSPAHTIANEFRDDKNQAAMFSVGELLTILKPRVVTLEETYGLFNRHKDWFNALVKMFLDRSYSIRWTGARLEEYGLPQKRRRLLIIAAGPGEVLPPFPLAQHGENNQTSKPLTTIQDAISAIPRGPNVLHHDIRAAQYQPSQFKPPYSPHTQAKTITTSGGIGNHHPSGKRAFTIRELASLQRFPATYKFADVNITELRRQIGNAVPPFVFKKVYREIIKSLRDADGISKVGRTMG